MDLKSLTGITRRALETEARRWGVREPHLRTRAELVRLILQHAAAAPFVAGRKRITEGRAALASARETFEVARHVAADLAGELLPFRSPEAAPGPAADAPSEADAIAQVVGEPQARGAIAPPPPPGRESDPAEVGAEEVPEAGYMPGLDPYAISEPVTAPPLARSLAPLAPPPRRYDVQSDRTLAMARLLAAQGERARALAIYEELIARDGDDPVPRREAQMLRTDGALRGVPMQGYTPTKVPGPPVEDVSPADALIHWEPGGGPGLVTARFDVSERGLARAQAILGQRGALTLRLVTVRPDAAKVVRTQVEDHPLSSPHGTFEIGPLDPQVRVLLSLGLQAGERFVSITHGAPPA